MDLRIIPQYRLFIQNAIVCSSSISMSVVRWFTISLIPNWFSFVGMHIFVKELKFVTEHLKILQCYIYNFKEDF